MVDTGGLVVAAHVTAADVSDQRPRVRIHVPSDDMLMLAAQVDTSVG